MYRETLNFSTTVESSYDRIFYGKFKIKVCPVPAEEEMMAFEECGRFMIISFEIHFIPGETEGRQAGRQAGRS